MPVFNRYPMVTQDGELPPKVLSWLDERYVNVGEVQDETDTVLNAVDYGMVAGTTTSQSAALSTVLQAAAPQGAEVFVPTGVYRMGNSVPLPAGARLRLAPGAVLDFSDSGASVYLSCTGTARPQISYPAPIAKGDTTISLSGHGMAAGDWCMIQSADVYDPDSTSICHGELIQVLSVGPGTVTFFTPTCDAYTTTVTITPVTLAKGTHVTGGTIRGSKTAGAGKTGIRAQYTEGLRLRDVRLENIDQTHVSVRDSVDAWGQGCTFEWAESTTMGYAFSFADTTRDSGCVRSTFRGVRHSLSTNNTPGASRGGVVRRISFFNNTVDYSTYALAGSQGGGDSIDTHTAAEDIWIAGNTTRGSTGAGINLECASGRIESNVIIGAAAGGINVHNESRRRGRITISNNEVRDCAGPGIYVRTGGRGTPLTYESIIITDNSVAGTTGVGIFIGYVLMDTGLVLTGNTVNRTGEQNIRIRKIDGAVIAHNNLSDGAQGMDLTDVANAAIGPDTIDAGAPTTAWTGVKLTNVTYSTFTPGPIKATDPGAVGVNIGSSCAWISLGKTGHINAPTQLVNTAGATVVQS